MSSQPQLNTGPGPACLAASAPDLTNDIRRLDKLLSSLAPIRAQLTGHAVYLSIRDIHDLHIFMGQHVFAVWDFMSLLKALQRALTCIEVPWRPTRQASSRLINSIVLDEESDLDPHGAVISHFDLYRNSMQACGASTETIDEFVGSIAAGTEIEAALNTAGAPRSVCEFVSTTFGIIAGGKPHEIAAAFTLGREDVIPDMFRILIANMAANLPEVELFSYYLERHIALDADDHGPLSQRMLQALCGDRDQNWAEAAAAAKTALRARIALWDGILNQLSRRY